MSLKQQIKEVLDQIDELERDARKYRDGEVKIKLTGGYHHFEPNPYAGDENLIMSVIKGPAPVRMVVDFYCKSFDETLSMYKPIERNLSGFMEFVRVLEEEEDDKSIR